jgi:hypothetical protein
VLARPPSPPIVAAVTARGDDFPTPMRAAIADYLARARSGHS